MTNVATHEKALSGEKHQTYSWLEDYLEWLEGKEAYRRFQDHRYEDHDYDVLMASLAA
jgi:hypothetical protein